MATPPAMMVASSGACAVIPLIVSPITCDSLPYLIEMAPNVQWAIQVPQREQTSVLMANGSFPPPVMAFVGQLLAQSPQRRHFS